MPREIHIPVAPLKIARVAAGLSQSDLAAVTGKSTTYIHRLETRGSALLTREIAEKIADAVCTPTPILFSGIRR
jgi:transcriptional regulator with XRE-family HTH domain